ncbi:DNA-binding transcriptional regulator YbjK [Conyzicola lurida]|uniref:DNA-binding transcriptional regulator YbjK n=1 Tax=Conyzicola lurida TaxID=1172621 RepID=A0A841ANY7_9MICO|nr:TetR family transcriptional regulator [Conyzicola lurida]MBB5844038.1 DNA-binding transcriptional regulator YbjK [Conyzicola lurida]
MTRDGRLARGEKTREALLDAAMRIIAESGVAAATQRTVAASAGASLASTTYHFGTRAELLSATMQHAASIAVARISALRSEILEGRLSLVDTCLAYIDEQRSGASPTAAVTFELALAASREPRLRDHSRAFVESLSEVFAPFAPGPGGGLAIAQSFYGVLLMELAHGPESRSPDLERTVTAVFDAFGVTEAAARHTALHHASEAGVR